VLGRYVLKEVLVPYGVGVFLFVALLTFDLLSSLSGVFLSRGAGAGEIALLILYRLPWTLSLALPLGLVFAILVGLSRLIRHSELKAAYAAGVPPLALLKPLLLLSLLVALVNLYNLAEVRPRALEAYDRALARLLYGEGGPSGVLRRQVYALEGQGVYYAEEVVPGWGRTASMASGWWTRKGASIAPRKGSGTGRAGSSWVTSWRKGGSSPSRASSPSPPSSAPRKAWAPRTPTTPAPWRSSGSGPGWSPRPASPSTAAWRTPWGGSSWASPPPRWAFPSGRRPGPSWAWSSSSSATTSSGPSRPSWPATM
jgi:lipopolysaccharide export system permease protein